MKRLFASAAAAALLAAGAAWADGAALVIGNGAYDHGPRAKSAERDARAVAEALADAGYTVVSGIDLTRVQMRAAMDQFAAAAEDADRLVIYYSGHAMRMQGRTFLAPVDFDPIGEVAVAMDGAPLAALMALGAMRPDAAVLFLDGAQLEGFEPTGFAEPGVADIQPPEGLLVVSAAAPGRAVRRSRWFSSDFSRTVVSEFLEPGAPLMAAAEAARDPIWIAGGVAGDAALVDAPEPEPAAATSSSSDVAQEIELAFWRSVEASGTAADYEAYLARYPNGLFAAIARNRVAEAAGASTSGVVAAAPSPSQTAAPRSKTQTEIAAEREAALGLNRAKRRQVQSDLTELGFDTNGVDGLFGRGTRGALRRWQEAEGRQVTGYLTRDQVADLRSAAQDAVEEREAAAAEAARLSAEEARAQEDADWDRARRVNTTAAYRRYLQAYPKGRYADEARATLKAAFAQAEAAAWAEAERLDTAEGYSGYLDNYPNSANAIEAQRRFDRLTASGYAAKTTASLQKEEAAWAAAQEENTTASYKAFRDAYPNSQFAEEAEARRLALYREQKIARERKLGLDGRSWKSIEDRLAFLDFDPGQRDGKVTKKTRNAILQYRRSRGLELTRYVDKKFIDILVNETKQPVDPTTQLLNQIFRSLQE